MGDSVLLAGAGTAGVSAVAWSRSRHLRDIGYAGIDNDAGWLETTGIARKIVVANDAAGVFTDIQEKELLHATAAADIVIIVAGLGGRTGAASALNLARIARRQGSIVMLIAILPHSMEPPYAQRRAERTLTMIASYTHILFALPLAKLGLGSCNAEDAGGRAQQLYDWVDRVVELATAPAPVNLIRRAAAHKRTNDMALGLYRRIILKQDALELGIEALFNDPTIIDAQLRTASDIAAVIRAETPRPFLVAQVLGQLSRMFPEDVAIDCAARAAGLPPDEVGVEIISFCPAPAQLAKRWTGIADMEWTPLMPWHEAKAEPIMAAHRGLFGHRFEVPYIYAPYSVPSAKTTTQVARGWQRLKETPQFAEGGFMEWLDLALSDAEAIGMRAIRRTGLLWSIWRGGGIRKLFASLQSLPREIIDAVRATPERAALRDRRSIVVVAALVAAPFLIASVAIANLAAIGRANILMTGLPNEFYSEQFVTHDEKRLDRAARATPVTAKAPGELGPAIWLPSALTAHMDRWAAREKFLNLHEFQGASPPFAFVKAAGAQADGQIRLVAAFAQERTNMPAQTLFALGLFPRVQRLAQAAGLDQERIASDLDKIFAAADDGTSNLDGAMMLAGCATVREAVARRFELKRFSPTSVSLPYSYYMAQLALQNGGACETNLKRASEAISSLMQFSDVSIVRRVDGSADKPTKVDYAVVVPPSLASQEEVSDDLSAYVAGLKAFYLLDYAQAAAMFDRLSASTKPVSSALGQYLSARTLFWRHEFARGSYRPDQFAPWRHIIDENGDGGSADGEGSDEPETASETGNRTHWTTSLPKCQPELDDEHCIFAVVGQNPGTGASELAANDAAKLKAIEAGLSRAPFVDPSYLRQYQGRSLYDDSDEPRGDER